MDAFFTDLGRKILSRWKIQNFSLDKFPDIACKALEEKPPAKNVDLPALMHDLLLNEEQAFQTDSPFGEPEIVAYSHPRFYIQLLFWMDGTTAIHQHEFSGAFHVMRGSSISAEYTFEEATTITPYLRVGQVRMKEIEILETGRTLPIYSGQRDIHSLFHLDSPSITVVVRTQHDPGTGPQFNYLPPHMAIDPHHADLLMNRRKQLLDVLERTEDASYVELVMQMTRDLDFERGFYLLQHAMGYLLELGEWDEAMEAFETKHGKLALGVEPTLREEVRRDTIKGFRGQITNPDHRFFLALLMNVPTREDLLALVKQRYPKGKPEDVVLRWADEMMEVSDEGVSILDAVFPETIEIEQDEKPEIFLAALGQFMNGGKKVPGVLKRLSKEDLRELGKGFEGSALGSMKGEGEKGRRVKGNSMSF